MNQRLSLIGYALAAILVTAALGGCKARKNTSYAKQRSNAAGQTVYCSIEFTAFSTVKKGVLASNTRMFETKGVHFADSDKSQLRNELSWPYKVSEEEYEGIFLEHMDEIRKKVLQSESAFIGENDTRVNQAITQKQATCYLTEKDRAKASEERIDTNRYFEQ